MLIQGSGGKKKQQAQQTPIIVAPVESPNTLSSKNTARIIDLISEGPIYGLVDGDKSVYFDDTPLQNSDGSYNFSGVTIATRLGEPDQDVLPGFPAVESEETVGVQLLANSGVVRTINDVNATAVRIKIRIPALYDTDSSGNIIQSAVQLTIEAQPNGGAYTTLKTANIYGKTNTVYETSYRVELPEGGSPWNIRVTRVNADSPTSSRQNSSFWSSYTKIIDAKLIYPDSALVGLTVDRQQFGNELPTRSYDIKGLKISVPSNYNPVTRVYTGIWNGTFQTAWTDNPAWVLWDLLTNERYGLGKYINADQLDKFTFYEYAQYNDELVPDGEGGTEPRFTFNGVINSARDAYDVLNAVASNFRAMLYWSSGLINVVQDKPTDATKLVTPANVIDGKFNYSGTALSATHSAVLVSWNDPNDGYRLGIASVEDNDQINTIGYRKTDTVAIGCTSEGQAIRFGKWILDTEKNETETVTYIAGFDHADVTPGQIIHVADPAYASVRYGGRVVGWFDDELTIDQAVTLQNGESYTLSVQLDDGSIGEYEVISPAGSVTTLQLSSAIDAVSGASPVPGAIWILTGTDVAPRPFRVLAVREIEKNQFEVTALFHDTTKYDRIEENVIVERASFTAFPSGALSPPTDLAFSEYLYSSYGTVKSTILVSWAFSPDPRTFYYELYVKDPGETEYRFLTSTTGSSYNFTDNITGTYGFKVRAVDGLGGVKSSFLEATFEAGGLAAPPSQVTNFNIQTVGESTYLTWDAVTDLDLSHYVIRYSPQTSGVTWGTASVLIPQVPKTATSTAIATRIGTYLIKAVDTSGVESTTESSIATTIGDILNLNVVATVTENPTFSGDHEDPPTTVVIDNLLRLSGQDTVDDWANIDNILNWDVGDDGIVDEGYYTFYNYHDNGEVYTCRLTPNLYAYGADLLNSVDAITDIDAVLNWDGADPSSWGVELQVRYTSDDPLDSDATWSAWATLVVGDYTARGFEFRLILTSLQTGISPMVQTCEVQIDMPDRTDGARNITSDAAGTSITYSPAFKATPVVNITAINMQTGDYYTISSESRTGFTIRFFNSGGTGVSRVFNWISKGYGVQV